MWGSWDDPRARATRGLRRPSLDARSWDHPSYPLSKYSKLSLAAALLTVFLDILQGKWR
jgi:hypothetical protein